MFESAFSSNCAIQSNQVVSILRGYDGEGHWVNNTVLPAGFNTEKNWLILKTQQTGSTLYYACTQYYRNLFISSDLNCGDHGSSTRISSLGYIYNNPTGPFNTPLYLCWRKGHYVSTGLRTDGIPAGTPYGIWDFFISDQADCESTVDNKQIKLLGYVVSLN